MRLEYVERRTWRETLDEYKHLISERAIYDYLLTFAYDRMFERFPNLRICSVENGSAFLADRGAARVVAVDLSEDALTIAFHMGSLDDDARHIVMTASGPDARALLAMLAAPDGIVEASP